MKRQTNISCKKSKIIKKKQESEDQNANFFLAVVYDQRKQGKESKVPWIKHGEQCNQSYYANSQEDSKENCCLACFMGFRFILWALSISGIIQQHAVVGIHFCAQISIIYFWSTVIFILSLPLPCSFCFKQVYTKEERVEQMVKYNELRNTV